MKPNEKRDLVVAGVAVGVVALLALAGSAHAKAGYTPVAVQSGAAELVASSTGGYAFNLPAGGAWTAAQVSSVAGGIANVLVPAGSSGPLTLTAPSGSLITLSWTSGGTQQTSVYTVQ